MLGIVIVCVGLGLAPPPESGQAQAAGGRETPPAAAKPSPEEAAVRAADAAFEAEYNRADAKALAVRFAADAEVIEADGTRYRGRELIEQRMAETFAASPGVKLRIQSESIRFLSPDVASEEGVTTITPAGGTPETRRHTALLVRRDGHWLISSIREEEEPFVPPHDRLKELEWMIGEWVDEGSDAQIRVSCRWSDDKNFLVRTFHVRVQGKPAMTIHQRVGWDPLAKQFRSWEFDSEGGYGEGRWSRDGERWIIKHAGARPEGVAVSATHIMVRERPDLVRWVAVDRSLGGDSIPQEETFAMVKVPPQPQSPAPAPVPNPSPAPNQPGRPQ